MFDVEGFILVGGQSSRMGSDKSQLSFGKQTAVERIGAALGPLTATVRLVGAPIRAGAVGLDSVRILMNAGAHWGESRRPSVLANQSGP